MDELEYTCVKLETLKMQGDIEAGKAMAGNDEELYRVWDMYRLEISSALSRIHDVIDIQKERENVRTVRLRRTDEPEQG